MIEKQHITLEDEVIQKWMRRVMIVHGIILALAVLAMWIVIPMFGEMFADF